MQVSAISSKVRAVQAPIGAARLHKPVVMVHLMRSAWRRLGHYEVSADLSKMNAPCRSSDICFTFVESNYRVVYACIKVWCGGQRNPREGSRDKEIQKLAGFEVKSPSTNGPTEGTNQTAERSFHYQNTTS